MRKSIIAIAQHPDDLEIAFGKTFAKYCAQGYEGVYIILMNGTSGHVHKDFIAEIPPDVKPVEGIMPKGAKTEGKIGSWDSRFIYGNLVTKVRRQELRRAAKMLGAKRALCLNFAESFFTTRDGRFLMLDWVNPDYGSGGPPDSRHPMVIAHKVPQYLRELADVFLEYEPELVLGTGVCFSNIDHTACLNFVRNAFIMAAREKELGTYYVRQWPEPTFPVYIKGEELVVEFDDWTYADIAARAMAEHRCQMGNNKYEDYLKGKEKAIAAGHKKPAHEKFTAFVSGKDVRSNLAMWHPAVHPYELPGFPPFPAKPNPDGKGISFK